MDSFGRVEDSLSVECFANKKRLHAPQSREAAFAFQFHEDATNLFRFAHLEDKSTFKSALEILKAHVSAYEE